MSFPLPSNQSPQTNPAPSTSNPSPSQNHKLNATTSQIKDPHRTQNGISASQHHSNPNPKPNDIPPLPQNPENRIHQPPKISSLNQSGGNRKQRWWSKKSANTKTFDENTLLEQLRNVNTKPFSESNENFNKPLKTSHDYQNTLYPSDVASGLFSTSSSCASIGLTTEKERKDAQTIITFNVGGSLFSTSLLTLKKVPSYLTILSDPNSPFKGDTKSDDSSSNTNKSLQDSTESQSNTHPVSYAYFIDRDPTWFPVILQIIRYPGATQMWTGLPTQEPDQKAFIFEIQFYSLPSDLTKIVYQQLKFVLDEKSRASVSKIWTDRSFAVRWPTLNDIREADTPLLGGRGVPWRVKIDNKEIHVQFHNRDGTTVFPISQGDSQYIFGMKKSSGRTETTELRMYRRFRTGADHWWAQKGPLNDFSPFTTDQVLFIWTVWDGTHLTVPNTFVFLLEHT